MTTTALGQHHQSLGARMRDDDGWTVAGDFGNAAAEYAAITEGAATVDLGARLLIDVTGSDRVEFLQGMLTNDVAGLAPGQCVAALLLTIQGRVTADVVVVHHEDREWLDVDARAATGLEEALDKLIIADDVEMRRDASHTLVGLLGPAVATAVPEVASLAPWTHEATTIDDMAVHARQGGVLGADGVVLAVPTGEVARTWDALVARGVTPAGADAFEAVRIVRGVPRIGPDIHEQMLAIEAPVMDRISDSKGCYLGQEIVARGVSRGKINRRLCGVTFAGSPPAPGALLVHAGAEVGRVTSVAGPPTLATGVGLAMIRREHWEPGTVLDVQGEDGAAATVREWPLA